MNPDLIWLFATRAIRLFGFGALPVVLGSYLENRGLLEVQIGLLLSLTLLGDAALSLLITRFADRFGRRRLLMLSTILIAVAGVGFALSQDAFWLTLCAIFGTISPNGNEVGPFQALEQACVSQIVATKRRARVFGWYQMMGSLAAALGAFLTGQFIVLQTTSGIAKIVAEQQVFAIYAGFSLLLMLVFSKLSGNIEVPPTPTVVVSRPNTNTTLWHLSSLFALDSFGSALVMQSLIALWLKNKFGVDAATLGLVFASTNIVAALSTPLAGWLGERFGLVNTMVFTHIPANLFLLAFPFAPNLGWAIGLLIARFCLSQMDVPARTAFVMGIVPPEQRSFAAGLTQQGKLVGTSLGPMCSGLLWQAGLLSLPFVLGGLCKIAYDLALYRGFKRLEPEG